jgi:alpha-ketoglutarate-dependent taurine dioxygenase
MNHGLRYQPDRVAIVDRQLQLDWGDGHRSLFHPLWLRHQCECEHCGTPLNAVRALRLLEISQDLAIGELALDGERLRIRWSPGGHESVYRARWLRDHCYSESERRARKHRPMLWDAEIGRDPPVFDFAKVERDSVRRLDMLQAVCDYGFCKIENLPATEAEARRMIDLVGRQRQSHFGTYKLARKDAVNNVGDISCELPPHCDETYRTSTIGITVFQVIRPASEGGESTLVDGFEAARRLREQFPDDFALLARTPIFAQRFDPDHAEGELPHWYHCRLPMLQLDADGELAGVRINERQISPLDVPPDQVESTYRSIRHLLEFVYDPELMIRFALAAGEGLVFNNQRVLHGRSAFEAEQPGRSVLTSSVDLEEFYSSLRVLLARHRPELLPRVYPQGLVV